MIIHGDDNWTICDFVSDNVDENDDDNDYFYNHYRDMNSVKGQWP